MVQPVENDQMIGAFAPDRPDQAFNISVLPRRAERGGPVPDAHRSHASLERDAKCSVIVANEIHWATSMPSLSSSPWILGTPHSGFSRLILTSSPWFFFCSTTLPRVDLRKRVRVS